MTHFTDRPNIEEMTEMMYRDELEELLESDDSQWDLNMDDESNDFESYLGSTYDYWCDTYITVHWPLGSLFRGLIVSSVDSQPTMQNTTLTAEKIADYAVMLCDALYMNLKDYQIRAHQCSIQNEINMDYHQQKIDEIKNHGVDVEYYIVSGKKYFKIVMRDSGGQKSAHAFVDKTTGEVYKPASWRAPAKHVRYNLLNQKQREWLYENADWSGGYLYM